MTISKPLKIVAKVIVIIIALYGLVWGGFMAVRLYRQHNPEAFLGFDVYLPTYLPGNPPQTRAEVIIPDSQFAGMFTVNPDIYLSLDYGGNKVSVSNRKSESEAELSCNKNDRTEGQACKIHQSQNGVTYRNITGHYSGLNSGYQNIWADMGSTGVMIEFYLNDYSQYLPESELSKIVDSITLQKNTNFPARYVTPGP